MEKWQAKLLAMFGTFIIPFVTTMLPLKVSDIFEKKGEKGKTVLGCLMCFGGGVFFATYILHMGPEVTGILKDALLEPNHIDYPLAELIMAAGFFLVLYIEKFAVSGYGRHKKWKQKKEAKINAKQEKQNPKEANVNENAPYKVEYHHGDNINGDAIVVNGCNSAEMVKIPEETSGPDEEDIHGTRSLVLMLALSLHRIFEGMSVGLKYTVTGVWNLFIAVMCHEAVIGFSLGLQFTKNNFSCKRFLITTFLCSIIMPIGVGIGTLISEKGQPSNTLDIANGVLQAISTGTFIYVTFFEILHDELDQHNSSHAKLLSLLVGFGLMAALSVIPEESEVLPDVNMTIVDPAASAIQ